MSDFLLLGHDCHLEAYPSPVLPVGRKRDGELVVLYRTAGNVSEDEVPQDSEFVRYSDEQLVQLADFVPEHHFLFAYSEKDVRIVPIADEIEFLQEFLEDAKYFYLQPFIRLALAKQTKNLHRVIREIARCIPVMDKTPGFLQAWCEKEVGDLLASLDPGGVSKAAEGRRILVVEDNPAWALDLGNRFRRKGYSVQIEPDGIQGLAAALKQRPDIIVLDLAMAIMDGYEFLSKIKEIPQLADVKILILSAHSDQWDQRRSELNIHVTEATRYLNNLDEHEFPLPPQDNTQHVFCPKTVDSAVIDSCVESLMRP
jgi:CheY-like chemotaxis protein